MNVAFGFTHCSLHPLKLKLLSLGIEHTKRKSLSKLNSGAVTVKQIRLRYVCFRAVILLPEMETIIMEPEKLLV